MKPSKYITTLAAALIALATSGCMMEEETFEDVDVAEHGAVDSPNESPEVAGLEVADEVGEPDPEPWCPQSTNPEDDDDLTIVVTRVGPGSPGGKDGGDGEGSGSHNGD